MKKMSLILLAFCGALFVNELFVRYIIGYPSYGVEKRILGVRSSDNGTQNIYKAYSKYWSVEGGNNVFQRNNLGLYGKDVDISKLKEGCIFVLGSSFIEAMQIEPAKIATSIFFIKLLQSGNKHQVINLGHSGQDPYDNYLRCLFYEKIYNPDKIIIVLNDTYTQWLERHKDTLLFSERSNAGEEVKTFNFRLQKFLRNNFYSCNLLAQYLKNNNEEFDQNATVNYIKNGQLNKTNRDEIPSKLFRCIYEFGRKYGKKFVCISIISNNTINKNLEKWCSDNSVNFYFNSNINIPKNQLNNSGHLNENGNKLLGEFIYESYNKCNSK
jgi:hypothetical protein